MNKFFSVFFWCFGFWNLGCGVKGLPTPPDQPSSLGRGQPTFKEAVKEIPPGKIEPIEKEKKKEKKKDD